MKQPVKDDRLADKVGIVSVLVPLYNHQDTVEKTLNSLLLSDCTGIELIVCDDASKDDSFARAFIWIEANAKHFESVQIIRHSHNLGITGNLNFLTGIAMGEFITLLASDDELPVSSVDLQRTYLMNHPDVDFVYGNCATIDAESHFILPKLVTDRRAKWLANRRCAIVDLVFNWGLPWPRLFSRRTAFLKLGPYIKEHSFEDRWCALKIAQTRRFSYMHDVVHLYRVRAIGSATAGINVQKLLCEMHDVERRLAIESTGMLNLMLWIRIRSFRDEHKRKPLRLLWLLTRELIGGFHRLIVGN